MERRVPYSDGVDSGWRANLILMTTLAVLTAGAFVLLRFPPGVYHFYPLCPVRSATGFLCPGCGATRALALLLHGNVLEALRENALIILLLPCLVLYFLLAYGRVVACRPWPRLPHPAWMALLGLTALFTFYRN